MLDRNLLDRLRTPEGEAALTAAMELEPREETFLATSQRLARTFPETLARAAVEQAILRERARPRFSEAERMFFLREALEQATTATVARHRAGRFQGAVEIFDLGCGIGGDALELARVARVVAVDRDWLRLAVLAANAEALGLAASIAPVQADILHPAWKPRGALAFADPSRRRDGRRTRGTSAMDPPLRPLLDVMGTYPGSAVKLSPAVDRRELAGLAAELEFVSLEGELKEATLWLGSLRTASRRATILPGAASMTGEAEPELEVGGVSTYLYEPDPAVLRAELVHTLGARLGMHLIDPQLAFLSSAERTDTPFARCYQVDEVMPFGLKRLREALKSRGVGVVTVKKRGSPVDTESFQQRLRLDGNGEATVILTRSAGRRVAVIAHRRRSETPPEVRPS
ncbi:MAG TPA: class I SAM-dependent methyltransferase [Anaerolineales bacterium]|nr:class I SAM-dependent methyltransferase [Anaerolineales bacterium]